MDKGVAGHVASTGEIMNIPDAYSDERFNRLGQRFARTISVNISFRFSETNVLSVRFSLSVHDLLTTTCNEESFL